MLWEAQFGDFVNGAQIVVDQFIVSGRSKWGQTSRLVLLLPHGYEGNGPEHSSARLERFLQLAAQDNIRVVNSTTAAQFFHLLRRQALDATARPLVVMTPKGLLRLREATSTLDDLALRSFQPVLDDPSADHATVRRLVLCSGKIYYDIVAHELRESASSVAVARIEQLYPFPLELVHGARRARIPALEEIVWAQEEPQNMGAWRSIRHRLEEAAAQASSAARVQYVGRPWRASTSEGYPTLHQYEQGRIVRAALGATELTLDARPAAPHERRGHARAIPPCGEDELLPLLGRKPTPGLEHDERHRGRLDPPYEVDENGENCDRHRDILAYP